MQQYRRGIRTALHEENWPVGVTNMMPKHMARAFMRTRRNMVARWVIGTLRWVKNDDKKVTV